jgi:hypothetical protein
MKTEKPSRRFLLPIGLTLGLGLARAAALAPLTNPVTHATPAGLHLAVPELYLVFAPFFTLWDGASMLSMRRMVGLLIGLAVSYVLYRGWKAFARPGRFSAGRESVSLGLSLALLFGFLFIGATWHRPMLALAGVEPGQLVVDFHSHTNVSHDVRNTLMRGFDAETARRWHARAGFDALFITDHNTLDGLPAHRARARLHPTLCPGIEVSAWHSHIVLLGDTLPVERGRYNGSFAGLLTLITTSDSLYGALSVASLPEYRNNLWDRLDTLVTAGLDGFEIVNAAPKANELSASDRDSVVRFAHSRNRFLVGVSDSHGWGATNMVWNLVSVSGPEREHDLCGAVLDRLRDGFTAVQIIERNRLRPDDWWPMWLTPVGLVWTTWRTMGWRLTLAWFGWIWGVALLPVLIRNLSAAARNSLANGRLKGQDKL